MKRFVSFIGAACLLVLSLAVPAQAFEGDWYFDNNPGGREILALGDFTDNSFLLLRGSPRYCGVPGDSYAHMRNVLVRNGTNGQMIYWWIADSCRDGYVRVCIENRYNEVGCSTYIDGGWDYE